VQETEAINQPQKAKLVGYPITIGRMLLYHFGTLLLYHYVWAYKQFKSMLGPGKGKTFASLGFAIFLPFSIFFLIDLYQKRAAAMGLTLRIPKDSLGASFFVLCFLSGAVSRIFPNDWWTALLEPFTLIPLFILQRKINAFNLELHPDLPFAPKMNIFVKVAAIFGVLIYIALPIVCIALPPETWQ
jgi:hypothetical protein